MNFTINVKDIVGYPTPVLTDSTGIVVSINGTVTNDTNTVTESVSLGDVVVSVSKTGFYTYTNTFQAFGNDISVDILLVPIVTDISDPNYLKPYPFFTAYFDICSFNAYIYGTSSEPYGSYKYYVNNKLYDNSRNTVLNTISPGVFAIKQEITVLQDQFSTIPSVLWKVPITKNVTAVEFRPELTIAITSSSPSIVISQPVTIQISANLNSPTTGQQAVLSCVEGNVIYELFDINNTLVDSVSGSFDLSSPVFDPYIFTPEVPGDHILKVTLFNCCSSTTKQIVLSALDVLKIDQDEESITISNLSATNTLTVSLYNSTGITPIMTGTFPLVIAPTGNETIILTDGVYILKGNDGLKNYIVVLSKYTKLQACFESIIKEIICNPCVCEEECNPTKKDKRNELNKMIALGQTYFSYLQSFYGFNNMYTALSDGQLKDLFEIQTIFDTLSRYCGCNTNINKDCGCSH